MRLILASKSPRRKLMLEQLGLDFEVIVSNTDETMIDGERPKDLVKRLSRLKAEAVAKGCPDSVVIGSDAVVYYNGRVIGKPRGSTDEEKIEDARRTLRELSGKTHQVYSGVCVMNTRTGQVLTDYGVTNIRFRELSEKDVERAVANPLILGGAGSYVTDSWVRVFDSIEGSHTVVAGTPMEKLIPMLREAGVDV
ncbi:MAG: Maf family protein [Candidatus Aenigmatarchaeota archaeon]